jgi:transcriptional regulator with XRE-family HTH domain
MPVKKMGRLVEQARSRLARWLAGSPTLDQKVLARAVQHQQSWVSQYLSGRQQADVDELEAMARALGHTLNELFDLRENPQEQLLVALYRALPEAKREFAVRMLQEMTPEPARRKGTRARNDEQ